MEISTFLGLQTTLSGLLAHQRALDATAHNIANAATPGYTRQEAVLSAARSVPLATGGQVGTGVEVDDFRRIRDQFIDVQLRAQTMLKGYAEARQNVLEQVELSLNEPSDSGLSSLLNTYWSSWQDLANAPESAAARQALVQNANSLAQGFNALESQLSTFRSEVASDTSLTIDDINSTGAEIKRLTDLIFTSEATGTTPNDLLDQRDALLDKLGELGNVTVTTGFPNGRISVDIGGFTLIDGSSGNVFTAATGLADFTSLTSGKLAGLKSLHDAGNPGAGYLDQLSSDLDAVAAALISATNTQHALGVDLNGNAGGTFFTGTDAATIAVDPALLADVSKVAASSSASGEAGNADNALAIADLRLSTLVSGTTINDAYAALVTGIGSTSREAQRTYDNAVLLTNTLENRRQSVSGVSLDEEMANLMRFQRGYQASARALSAMDEMIDHLITRTGRVGL